MDGVEYVMVKENILFLFFEEIKERKENRIWWDGMDMKGCYACLSC